MYVNVMVFSAFNLQKPSIYNPSAGINKCYIDANKLVLIELIFIIMKVKIIIDQKTYISATNIYVIPSRS